MQYVKCVLLSIICLTTVYIVLKYIPHTNINPNPPQPIVIRLPHPPREFIPWYAVHSKDCYKCKTPTLRVTCLEVRDKLADCEDPNWRWNYRYERWHYDGYEIPGYTWHAGAQRWVTNENN